MGIPCRVRIFSTYGFRIRVSGKKVVILNIYPAIKVIFLQQVYGGRPINNWQLQFKTLTAREAANE